MKKFIVAGMAVAMLAAIPASASADVPRCEAAPATPASATFTMIEPRSEGGVWHTDFSVVVNPDGSFASGTTDVYGVDPDHPGKLDNFTEIVTSGSITEVNGQNVVTAAVTRNPYVVDGYTITNVLMDGKTLDIKHTFPHDYQQPITVSAPVFVAATTTDLNHGQYVKSQGGGSVAGKACAGMPLKSTQGK